MSGEGPAYDDTACRKLMAAVLHRAMLDAASFRGDAERAYDWLIGGPGADWLLDLGLIGTRGGARALVDGGLRRLEAGEVRRVS